MIGKSSMSNFDQNDTYGAAPDDGQKALVLHFFFHYQNYKRLLLKSYKKKLQINFIILNDILPILINLFGAQTSTNASLSSFITQ